MNDVSGKPRLQKIEGTADVAAVEISHPAAEKEEYKASLKYIA